MPIPELLTSEKFRKQAMGVEAAGFQAVRELARDIETLLAHCQKQEEELAKCQKSNWANRRRADSAEGELGRLREALLKAMQTAQGRWCEWGGRAESVAEILNDALYGPQPSGAQKETEK